MTSIWKYANPQLRDLAVYEPGKPVEETARELDVDPGEIIKLASNENPLGPSPKAREAMREALAGAQSYPDGGGFYLRKALAAKLGRDPDNLILGNGSNELIQLLCHAFLNRDDDVVISQYAFISYKLLANLFGARAIETPSPDFRQDLPAMLKAITAKTRLIFVANPNNPTGSLLPQSEIDDFIAKVPKHIVVALDEAYFEYLDAPPDTLQYIANKNVLVLRTFSKMHGLAGLRVGYGAGHTDLIQVLQKTREPFNVNSIGQVGAIAALTDAAHQHETRRVTDEGRAYLQEQFKMMGLAFVPSVANFVMVNVGDGATVFKAMLARKIIVRPLQGYDLPAWVRITVGTMDQNRKCIAALKEVLSNDQSA